MTDLDEYALRDRYDAEHGRVILSGLQALVRGPLDQVRADGRRGQRTAGLIAGYQGSPLGTVDAAYRAHQATMLAHDISFTYGVNEELAATMVWGSQQAARADNATHDGVIGLWYGKGPGLDRAGDAIRHANLAGVSATGGVLVAVGDDPACKSSTAPSASEGSLQDLAVPVLYPGSPQDVLDFARHGYEMSRASGAWIGIKIHTDVADGSATLEVGHDRLSVEHVPFERDGEVWVPATNDDIISPHSVAMEHESHSIRPLAAAHYARINQLDQTVGATNAWLGIVAAGKAYFDVRGALDRLGLTTDEQLVDAGIRIIKPALIWPLDEVGMRAFAAGLESVLVVEEKRPFLEAALKVALYGTVNAPSIIGKTDEQGTALIPSIGALEPDPIVEPLRSVLERRVAPERLTRRRERIPLGIGGELPTRTPYFCSGCPHNRSTQLPDGSTAGGGIGCHTMAVLQDRATGVTQMGGEGAQWAGRAPFVTETHRFQNIGDGTLAHSGFLAIRQAISAGTNITFKILYNGTVAMTGGQDAAGDSGVPELTRLLEAEGAQRIVVVSDDPGKYPMDARFAPGTDIAHRDRMDAIQRELREVPGTTILIYDQGCAAELRRARKRGKVETPTTRVVINEAVCDGCGHCGEISNCMSVHPVETPFGRKTRIHQESCNLDLTCLGGECPAFITVEVGDGPLATDDGRPVLDLSTPPEPTRPTTASILTVGIGGTGVVTVNQLLTTAALLDGMDANALDQTGLAQKGGPVVSHLHIGTDLPTDANRVGEGGADAYLIFDVVAGVADANLSRSGPGTTTAVVSTSRVPTGDMVSSREREGFPAIERFRTQIDAASRPDANVWVDAETITRELFRSQPAANLLVLGIAYQRGLIPVRAEAIERAIELNGVAVAMNTEAFRAGRSWAHDPTPFAGLGVAATPQTPPPPTPVVQRLIDQLDVTPALEESLRWRLPELVAFGGVPWARRFLATVTAAARAEAHAGGVDEFARTVSHQLAAFMLYKDEYEVARLHRDPALLAGIRARFGEDATIRYQLKPPTLAALGYDKKIGLGRRTGGAAFAVLAAAKRLRGTAIDPFGRTAERRMERELIDEYESLITDLIDGLGRTPSAKRLEEAVALAALADQVRGYSHVKEANVAAYRSDLQVALNHWRTQDSGS
ncbi:MAG: indolepyruvate ferredoxin oxidoreductase family protein [Actinomycetota bacterium]